MIKEYLTYVVTVKNFATGMVSGAIAPLPFLLILWAIMDPKMWFLAFWIWLSIGVSFYDFYHHKNKHTD